MVGQRWFHLRILASIEGKLCFDWKIVIVEGALEGMKLSTGFLGVSSRVIGCLAGMGWWKSPLGCHSHMSVESLLSDHHRRVYPKQLTLRY